MVASREQWIGSGLMLAGLVALRMRSWQIQRTWPAIRESDILFRANRLSGRSLKNLFTRMGGASQCLTVTVTQEEMRIHPFFLFRLFADVYDLDLRILKRDIVNITKERRLWIGEQLCITYEPKPGDVRRFELSGGNLQRLHWAIENGRAER